VTCARVCPQATTTGGSIVNVTGPVGSQQWGTNEFTANFGFTPVLSIGGFVWVDCNLDGVQNDAIASCSMGSGIAGVLVALVAQGVSDCVV
jgi:hypothetical protein